MIEITQIKVCSNNEVINIIPRNTLINDLEAYRRRLTRIAARTDDNIVIDFNYKTSKHERII